MIRGKLLGVKGLVTFSDKPASHYTRSTRLFFWRTFSIQLPFQGAYHGWKLRMLAARASCSEAVSEPEPGDWFKERLQSGQALPVGPKWLFD